MTQDDGTAGSAFAQTPRFDVAMRGYERSQVDEHIARLSQELNRLNANLRQEREFARTGSQQLVIERDNALQQLTAVQDELADLRGFGDATVEPTPAKDEISLFGNRLQTILTSAEQEANAVKAEAQEAADLALEEASQQAETLVSEANQQADALVSQARSQADTLRTEATQEAEGLRAEAKQESDTLRAEAKQETDTLRARTKRETDTLRAETTRDTDTQLAQAEQEADTLLAEARQEATRLTTEATAEAERLVTAANQDATTTLDTARREDSKTRASLAELVQLREQVRRQLTDIGAAIGSLLGDHSAASPATEAKPSTNAGTPSAPEPASVEVVEDTGPTVPRSSPQPVRR